VSTHAIAPAQFNDAKAELARYFPHAVVWYGHSTRNWWAMVWCGRWRLVEASSPYELAQAINGAAIWPWPRA
jgi:hypothetical protein